MTLETAFVMHTASIKYGVGATREVGPDMKALGARRVMVVTDPNLKDSQPVQLALEALRDEGIRTVLFDQAHVEPTDLSFKAAIQFAMDGRFDGYVAVGGGSTMDTAKVANLYATYPADFLAYVNPPIGGGKPVRRGDFRLPGNARQDRDRSCSAPSGTGHRRSEQHRQLAANGHRLHRMGCVMPCPGVVDRPSLRSAAGA
jgi:hypothetical protein